MGTISDRADRFVTKLLKQHGQTQGPPEEQSPKMVALYERLRKRRKHLAIRKMPKRIGR